MENNVVRVSDLEISKNPEAYLEKKASRKIEQSTIPAPTITDMIALKRENTRLKKENITLKELAKNTGGAEKIKNLEDQIVELKNKLLAKNKKEE